MTDFFPWLTHRTLAEVDETARLLERKRLGRAVVGLRARRLDELLDRADMNNPPSTPCV